MDQLNTKTETEATGAPIPVISKDLLGWISVSEKMPPAGKRVLVSCYHEKPEYPWRAIAKWMPAGTLDAEYWDTPPDEWWDEDGEKCLCPFDAWWEDPFTTENCTSIEHVTHWMELPSNP